MRKTKIQTNNHKYQDRGVQNCYQFISNDFVYCKIDYVKATDIGYIRELRAHTGRFTGPQ